ncbi:MAG: hypothetical protein ACLURV_05040 [Gallintestinimicrobium sp.]
MSEATAEPAVDETQERKLEEEPIVTTLADYSVAFEDDGSAAVYGICMITIMNQISGQ